MKTIALRSNSFVVRDTFPEILSVVASGTYKSIQDLLVQSFPLQDSWMSAEYAAMVHLVFPDSTIPERAQARATQDVRKYNKGELSGQDGTPKKLIKLLDAGEQKRSMASDIGDAMENMRKLLDS